MRLSALVPRKRLVPARKEDEDAEGEGDEEKDAKMEGDDEDARGPKEPGAISGWVLPLLDSRKEALEFTSRGTVRSWSIEHEV